MQGKVRYQPIGFELLPAKFPLRSLQHLYEVILERPLDKRNFRKKILSMDVLEELDEIETDVAHRAARLYRFDKRKYRTRNTPHRRSGHLPKRGRCRGVYRRGGAESSSQPQNYVPTKTSRGTKAT